MIQQIQAETSYKWRIALFDNGSLRAASTLSLRAIASRLQEVCGHKVDAVSLLHSGKIPSEELGGIPAQTLVPYLREGARSGHVHYWLMPFFFGPSRAFTEYLPEKLAKLRESFPDLRVELADPLAGASGQDCETLARALFETLLPSLYEAPGEPSVVLVDHGSPEPRVTEIRNRVGSLLDALLQRESPVRVKAFSVASMERREEPEYDFNEPLLESVLRQPPFSKGPTVVSLMFLSPGRHAGKGGDIAGICEAAQQENPLLHPLITSTVGEHPLIGQLLLQRLNKCPI